MFVPQFFQCVTKFYFSFLLPGRVKAIKGAEVSPKCFVFFFLFMIFSTEINVFFHVVFYLGKDSFTLNLEAAVFLSNYHFAF